MARASTNNFRTARCIQWALVVGALCFLVLSSGSAAAGDVYVRLRVEGVMNPIQARHVKRGVERAQNEGALLLLLTLDTPGGLVASMQEIVATLSNAAVPIVAFVEPRSAQATSAGAFVLLAADVAAMAPGTRVGAAHPVGLGEPLQGALDAKATNSLSSLIVSLAQRRGRPSDLAEAMVRESASYTAEQAHEKKLVELLARDEGDLLRQLDGLALSDGKKLATAGLARVDVQLSALDSALDKIADPTVTSLLLSVGTLAIIYELTTAGIGAGGAIGALMLVLGLLGSSVLPIEASAVALLVIGLVAIALEVKLPTHGMLGGAGLSSLLLGSLMLIDPSEYFGGVARPNIFVLAPVLGVAALGLWLLARVARRSLGAPAQTGIETLIGKGGQARSTFGLQAPEAEGQVFVDGARWRAETREELIRAGETIEVVAVSTSPMRLSVRRKQ
ncbi:MAG TPA: NfeD family protein [Polyangiaceae bacterium]|nr:NfeD family protein [Polyangiaceae bacterium]